MSMSGRHEQYYWRWHWHWLFGGIDIDNWHWIGDFWIIDIDIDIDVGQLSWLNIDIDIEVRKTLTLILTLRVFLKKIIDIDIEHWVFYIEVFEKVYIDVEYPILSMLCKELFVSSHFFETPHSHQSSRCTRKIKH